MPYAQRTTGIEWASALARLLLAFAFLCVTACADLTPAYLTVSDLWQDAAALDGQRVTVRGWEQAVATSIGVGCIPPACGCNTLRARLLLSDAPEFPHDYRDSTIEISDVECAGDDCSLRCSPFNHRAAPAYELVGRLRVVVHPGGAVHLFLQDLDLEASSQLDGGLDLAAMERSPLDLGHFTCTCPSSNWLDDCYEAGVSLTCDRQ